jgi:hypothetical protein
MIAFSPSDGGPPFGGFRARKKALQKDAKVKRFVQSPGGRSVEVATGLGEGPPSAVRVPWVGANRDLERQLGQAARAAAAALVG